MASIAGRTNGERAIAETTDLLSERCVHDVGAAARFDWTRRANRGTRETTGSVAVGASRRSPRAWSFYLQAFTSTRRTRRQPTAIPSLREGARRQLLSSIGVIATAAERLHGSSMTADFKRDSVRGVQSTNVQIYAVSNDR
jgi:hypothetical protein